jgi:hypothetical protein
MITEQAAFLIISRYIAILMRIIKVYLICVMKESFSDFVMLKQVELAPGFYISTLLNI